MSEENVEIVRAQIDVTNAATTTPRSPSWTRRWNGTFRRGGSRRPASGIVQGRAGEPRNSRDGWRHGRFMPFR